MSDASTMTPRLIAALDKQILHVIDSAGNLRYYQNLAQNGTASWAPGSGNVIGNGGYGQFVLACSGGKGVLYLVDGAGNLKWYQATGSAGTESWAPGSGSIIGRGGWDQFLHIFATSNGEIYCVNRAGDLLWYQYAGTQGSEAWAPGSGKVIASHAAGESGGHGSWDQYARLCSGDKGVIYAVKDGDLYWFQNLGTGGTVNWAAGSGSRIGAGGWDQFSHMACSGENNLYCVDGNGKLRWYKYIGSNGVESFMENSGCLVGDGTWPAPSSGTFIYEYPYPNYILHYHPHGDSFSLSNVDQALDKQASSIELDLHWYKGEVVVNHDPPSSDKPSLEEVFERVFARCGSNGGMYGQPLQFFFVLEPKANDAQLFDGMKLVLEKYASRWRHGRFRERRAARVHGRDHRRQPERVLRPLPG